MRNLAVTIDPFTELNFTKPKSSMLGVDISGKLKKSKKNFKKVVRNFKWTMDVNESLVGYKKTGLFITIYAFFITLSLEKILMDNKLIAGQPLQVLLFPLAAALEFVGVIIAIIQLYKNPNRSRQQIANFVINVVKAAIIIVAVAIGVVGTVKSIHLLSFTLAPWLFIVATTLQAAFSLAKLVFYSVKWYQAAKEKNPVFYQKYKQNFWEAIKNFIVDGVVVAATFLLFVFILSIPAVVVTIFAIFTMAVLAMAAVITIAKKYCARITEVNKLTVHQKSYEQLIEAILENRRIQLQGYQGRLCSHQLITELKNKKAEEKKECFIKTIENKIEKLEQQINRANNHFIHPQNKKREAKVRGLEKLKKLVEKYSADKDKVSNCATYSEIDAIIADKKNHPGLFRSYEKSETKALFIAAKQLFMKEDNSVALRAC